MDVVFVLGGSSRNFAFRIFKSLVANIIDQLDIKPHVVQVGIVVYDDDVVDTVGYGLFSQNITE